MRATIFDIVYIFLFIVGLIAFLIMGYFFVTTVKQYFPGTVADQWLDSGASAFLLGDTLVVVVFVSFCLLSLWLASRTEASLFYLLPSVLVSGLLLILIVVSSDATWQGLSAGFPVASGQFPYSLLLLENIGLFSTFYFVLMFWVLFGKDSSSGAFI